jgi:hypothetical protein
MNEFAIFAPSDSIGPRDEISYKNLVTNTTGCAGIDSRQIVSLWQADSEQAGPHPSSYFTKKY